jgi:MFS family permease
MAEPLARLRPVGYSTLLRTNRGFRSVWMSEVVSLFGDWFNLIASAALISQLTQASGSAIGGLFVVRMLAPFLISPLAGVAADRYNRKRLLVLADLSRVVIVLGFLLVRSPGDVWLLYTLTAFQLGISGIAIPARTSLLPDIVSRTELGAANALISATWSVMLAVGAAVGGFVAGRWGIYPAFVIDALTFLVSALILTRLVYTPPPEQAALGRKIRDGFNQYVEGLLYLKRRLDILILASHKAAVALATNGILTVFQVVLAERHFPFGEGGGLTLGIFYAIGGIGTGIGPLAARRFTRDREPQLRLALAMAYGLVILGVALMANISSFWLVSLGFLIRAVGGGINWVFSTQLLLHRLPAGVRGRVFSTEFALLTLANAISAGVGGWLLDHTAIGLLGLVWVMAALTFIPGLLWLAWMVWGPTPAPDGQGEIVGN